MFNRERAKSFLPRWTQRSCISGSFLPGKQAGIPWSLDDWTLARQLRRVSSYLYYLSPGVSLCAKRRGSQSMN